MGRPLDFFNLGPKFLGKTLELVFLLGVFFAFAFLLVFTLNRLFGPSGPVAVASHVVSGQAEEFEGLDQELLLREDILDKVRVVGVVLKVVTRVFDSKPLQPHVERTLRNVVEV